MDEAVRAIEAVPDEVPGKRLIAAMVFGFCFLLAVLVYFAPEREERDERES
jgi:hypothetical protein